MFNLEPVSEVSMKLRRRGVDFATTSSNPDKIQIESMEMSTEDKFRYKTSGLPYGGREQTLTAIHYAIGGTPYEDKSGFLKTDGKQPSREANVSHFARIGVGGIYQEVLKKLEANSSDFDQDTMQEKDMIMWIKQNIGWVLQEINTKLRNGESEDFHLSYITEADQGESDENMITTDAFIMHADMSAHEEKDIDPDREYQAKLDLINALTFLKEFQETTLTGESTQNAIKLIQAHWAHDPFAQFQISMRDTKQEKDLSIPQATAQSKLWGSLDLNPNNFIKTTIDNRLAEMIKLGQEYALEAYRLFAESCNTLNIDLVLLDADKIMEGNYINKLRQTLMYKKTAIVNEYDIEVMVTNPEDFSSLKMAHVSQLLAASTVLTKKKKTDRRIKQEITSISLSKSIKDQIDEVNLFNFRNLNSIAGKVQEIHKKKAEVHVDPSNPNVQISKYHAERIKQIQTSLLVGVKQVKRNGLETVLEGPLAEGPLKIINKEIDKFLEDIVITNYDLYCALSDSMVEISVGTKFEEKPLEEKGGFFRYVDDKRYYEIEEEEPFHIDSGDKKFKFKKWLLHSSGFLVSKYLDATTNSKGDMDIFRAPDNENDHIHKLIIKTIPATKLCPNCGERENDGYCDEHKEPITFPSVEIFRGTTLTDYE